MGIGLREIGLGHLVGCLEHSKSTLFGLCRCSCGETHTTQIYNLWIARTVNEKEKIDLMIDRMKLKLK